VTAQTVPVEHLSAPNAAAPRTRLLYLDNLRLALITFVVLGHLSVTYGFDADWTYYEIGEASPIFNVLVMLVLITGAGFALGLFFMLAGYFTPAAYDRKGAGQFLLDRLKRLGIPWLIFEVFINPFIHYAVDVHGGACQGALYDCQYQGTLGRYLLEFPRLSGSIGDGPVWFLEALLIFSFVYALGRKLTASIFLPARRARALPSSVPGNGAIALFALLIGLSTFVVRFWARAFVQYEPLHLEFARFPQYAALFAVGMLAYRRGWLAGFSDSQARTWRFVALGCLLALPPLLVSFGALTGSLDERAGGGVNILSLAYSVWEGFLSVSMVISVLAWFRRRFNHQGRLARGLSDSAFTVYVIHPGIIVPFALALSGIRMNLSLKFLLVAPVAIGLCYLAAYVLRKAPGARAVLGGSTA
jgi:glucans biosynthesis protein C